MFSHLINIVEELFLYVYPEFCTPLELLQTFIEMYLPNDTYSLLMKMEKSNARRWNCRENRI